MRGWNDERYDARRGDGGCGGKAANNTMNRVDENGQCACTVMAQVVSEWN